MNRSTRIRRNANTLSKIDLAAGLTCVQARRKEGVKLHTAYTSQQALTRIDSIKHPSYEQLLLIRELLAE